MPGPRQIPQQSARVREDVVGSVRYLVRFFRVVSPVSSMTTCTFIVLTLVSTVAIVTDPLRSSSALVPVLLLQSLAASSGFALPARRGHYDLLLTTGHSRTSIAVVHWAMSIAPGLASWLTLAILESFVSGGDRHDLSASGTCAAVFLVSTLPWALTVGLPRFSGGIGWMLVAVTASTTLSTDVFVRWTVASTRIEELVWPAWSFLVYPPGVLGRHLDRAELLAVIPALALGAGAVVAACHWVARRDVPLEAAQ